MRLLHMLNMIMPQRFLLSAGTSFIFNLAVISRLYAGYLLFKQMAAAVVFLRARATYERILF